MDWMARLAPCLATPLAAPNAAAFNALAASVLAASTASETGSAKPCCRRRRRCRRGFRLRLDELPFTMRERENEGR